MTGTVTTRLYPGFEDPELRDLDWDALLGTGSTDTVFLTREYQRAWWSTYGRGELLLIGVEGETGPVALAPLFADGGMVFPVGSGGSDYLDVVGDVSTPGALEAVLRTAADATPGFQGARFYHVPEASPTGPRLARAAEELGWRLFDEGSLVAPVMDLDNPAIVDAAIGKKSLRRHERWFAKHGALEVEHLSDGRAIAGRLEPFFDQHVRRWEPTEYPSLFEDEAHRGFYRTLVAEAAETGWLRFTELRWKDRPIAFHFGFHYRGAYLWYKPTFEIELARRSPGEVLIRHLLRAAADEGAEVFDLGLGDEAFKRRFATRAETVTTWGLYPAEGT